MIQLRPYTDLPHRTFVVSAPERAEADDILDRLDKSINSGSRTHRKENPEGQGMAIKMDAYASIFNGEGQRARQS